jgi:structural maintenance of chromosome 4
LKGYGVDLDHKRFLILQGEVESIALMKPKGQGENEDGLLEYLEDIIGTCSYKSKIAEHEAKLEEFGQTRDEKLSQLKLIQKETKNLQGQSLEAIKFIDTENKFAKLQNQATQKQISQAQNELSELESQNVIVF